VPEFSEGCARVFRGLCQSFPKIRFPDYVYLVIIRASLATVFSRIPYGLPQLPLRRGLCQSFPKIRFPDYVYLVIIRASLATVFSRIPYGLPQLPLRPDI
jgi:hypothetical protein